MLQHSIRGKISLFNVTKHRASIIKLFYPPNYNVAELAYLHIATRFNFHEVVYTLTNMYRRNKRGR